MEHAKISIVKNKKSKINVHDKFKLFLNNNEINTTENEKKIQKSNLINTRNVLKRQLCTILLDNWFLYEVSNDEYVYVKHILSDKQNLLYQIILGEEDYSGIYEFQFIGMNIDVNSLIKNDKCYLEIISKGNFGLADLYDKKGNSISLMEQTEKEFISSLKNYLKKEEIDIYYKPDLYLKNYLIKNLPRIILKAE